MESIAMGSLFGRSGFRGWKLQTAGDYFFFFLIVLAGVLVFYALTKYLKKRRTREDALRRTAGKLRFLGGSGAECYVLPTLSKDGETITPDLLAVSGDRVYVVRVYHKALEVSGTAGGERWRFALSPKDTWYEDNPLPLLLQQQRFIKSILREKGLDSVPVERLIVFADRFGSTHIGLEGVQCAFSIEKLRTMKKRAQALAPIDIAQTKEALEAGFA